MKYKHSFDILLFLLWFHFLQSGTCLFFNDIFITNIASTVFNTENSKSVLLYHSNSMAVFKWDKVDMWEWFTIFKLEY